MKPTRRTLLRRACLLSCAFVGGRALLFGGETLSEVAAQVLVLTALSYFVLEMTAHELRTEAHRELTERNERGPS